MMILDGYDKYVRSELVAVVLKPGSSPVKRMRKDASGKGVLVDATSGHKTRSVLLLSTGQVVLSSLQTETVQNRVNKLGWKNRSRERLRNEGSCYDNSGEKSIRSFGINVVKWSSLRLALA